MNVCIDSIVSGEDNGGDSAGDGDKETDIDSSYSVISYDIDSKAEGMLCMFEFAVSAGKKCQLTFTCSCEYDDGKPCSLRFTQTEHQSLCAKHQSLYRDELDLTFLSQIQAGIHIAFHPECCFGI